MNATSTSFVERKPAEQRALRWTHLDTFVVLNLGLDALVWWAFNFERYQAEIGLHHTLQVLFYATGLVALLAGLWRWLRQQRLPVSLLLTAQCFLLAHFAGAVIHLHGMRLNACLVLGIRFNKFVVFGCTFVVAWLFAELAQAQHLRRNGLLLILIALAALGIGAGVEIFQYLGMRLAAVTEVARFEESERDLVASCAGAGLWLLWASTVRQRIDVTKFVP